MKQPRVSVVLGNLLSSKGELNAETMARIDLATKLDSELRSDVIVLCGWAYRPDCSLTIADAMKSYILTRSPKLAGRAVCQKLSRDTVGDAVFTRLYLRELFVGLACVHLSVVTSDYHASRTQEVFDFIFGANSFISVQGAPGFNSDISVKREAQSLAAFRKTFFSSSAGDLDSIYFSLRNNHPFYNGAIYPQIDEMTEVSSRIRRSLGCL